MSDTSLAKQIERQERKILGAQDWLTRAQRGAIKRAPEAIEKAAADLEIDKAMLATLRWLERNYETVKTAVGSKEARS